MATQKSSPQKSAPRPQQPRRQSTERRTVQNSGANTGLIIGLAVLFVLLAAVGVYAWLQNTEHAKETADLRTKVKFLEKRMDNTENAIVQITAGGEIFPAMRGEDDGNVVINKNAATTAERKDAGRAQQPAGKSKAAAPTKATASKRTTATAGRTHTRSNGGRSYADPEGYYEKPMAARISGGDYMPDGGARYTGNDYNARDGSRNGSSGNADRPPSQFGNTTTPPAHVHYAVLIDSYGTRRNAEITKALFVLRYGAYIRKIGDKYNVYAGWYRDINEAREKLRQLRNEYGPSCRIATLYH